MPGSHDYRSRSAKPVTIHGCAQSGDFAGFQKCLNDNPSLINARNAVVRFASRLSSDYSISSPDLVVLGTRFVFFFLFIAVDNEKLILRIDYSVSFFFNGFPPQSH